MTRLPIGVHPDVDRDVDGRVRVGAVVMHHPRRADRLPPLLRACEPLRPVVVPDPDPTGRPSPLRTAKRAWASVADGVTHHLVLQDDVRPVPGFAAQVHAAVAGRPDDAVALFCMWHSPHNSYLVRRAAVAGAAYAALSPTEWTPAQALVLPAALARDLAAYLARIPDEAQDDDEMIVTYCREQGVRVVAAVPHLVEHGHDTTLVGNHRDGLHGAVVTPGRPWPAGQSVTGPDAPPAPYAVELRDSRCLVRPLHGDPVEHQFGWYWYDAAPALGVDPEEVLDQAAPYLRGTSPAGSAVRTEAWAAGYLLGADAARLDRPPATPGPLTTVAVASWVDQGLADRDRDDGVRDACVQVAGDAVAHALRVRAATRRPVREEVFADAF